MALWDTELFPVQIADGKVSGAFPAGTIAIPAPRRCARGRTGELVLISLSAPTTISSQSLSLENLAALTAQVYFETPGSVTSALRAAFTACNAEFLPCVNNFPAFTTPSSEPSQLHGVCAVLHEQELYLGYAGSVLVAILCESGVELFPAVGDSASRGMGLSQTVDLRYGHTKLSGPATLILAAAPEPSWSVLAAPLHRLSLQAIADRMAQQTTGHPAASRAGTPPYSALLARLFPVSANAKKTAPQAIAALRSNPQPIETKPQTPATVKERRQADIPAEPEPKPSQQQSSPLPPPAPARVKRISDVTDSSEGSARLTAWDALFAFSRSLQATQQAFLRSVRRWTAGILPRGILPEDDSFSLPPNLMLATAIAIPLVVIAIAGFLYFQKGRELEFERLMQSARIQASVASASSDPLQAKAAWTTTLELLEEASRYGSSNEMITMRSQSARTIDAFDGIVPLDFQPAFPGGLETGTRITALLAGDRELYALDSSGGRVLRLVLGQGGYQLDDSFYCQAGVYPDILVGVPVDIAWVPDIAIGAQQPTSARGGAIVALDSSGVLLYCPAGGRSMAGQLRAPRTGWIAPAAIDYYNGRLYVLDPGSNGFWRYEYSPQDTHFSAAPSDYLSEKQDHSILHDAIDFTVAAGEMFLLHADGSITHCQYDPLYSSETSTALGATLCSPLDYNSIPPDRTAGPRITNAMLTRVFYNEPPEPTLFFLDSFGRGAYRFSLALNFYSRYRVTIAPENEEATAIAVGKDKTLFIAVGNQIYYASTRNR